MEWIGFVLATIIVIFVAYMALKHGKQNRGKSYEQRRDEMYDHYEKRMAEFRQTEMKKGDSPKKQ